MRRRHRGPGCRGGAWPLLIAGLLVAAIPRPALAQQTGPSSVDAGTPLPAAVSAPDAGATDAGTADGGIGDAGVVSPSVTGGVPVPGSTTTPGIQVPYCAPWPSCATSTLPTCAPWPSCAGGGVAASAAQADGGLDGGAGGDGGSPGVEGSQDAGP